MMKTFCLLLLCFYYVPPAWAKPKLALAQLEGRAVNDLPPPYNLQAVPIQRTVSLSWAWDPPDPGPEFLSFGYEVFRDAAPAAIVAKTAYTDFDAPVGSHTYQIRAKGGTKEKGQLIAHFSDFSEPVESPIKLTCSGPPAIHLAVQPMKRSYREIQSLRLHLTGDVGTPDGCHVDHVAYSIDSGLSAPRTGALTLDAGGHFDATLDALGPDEEPISGNAAFTVTVTAHDEAGAAVSDAYTLDLQRENPFAPKHPTDSQSPFNLNSC